MGIQYVPIEYRYVAIFGFFLITYLISAWALFDDLKGIEWLTILSLPSLYAAAIGLFYFLLPKFSYSHEGTHGNTLQSLRYIFLE